MPSNRWKRRRKVRLLAWIQQDEPFSLAWLLLVTGTAIASGVAQLSVSGTAGRIILLALLTGSLSLLGLGALMARRNRRREEWKALLVAKDRLIRRYQEAVEGIVQEQPGRLSECVDITMTVGAHRGQDVVKEVHRTRPLTSLGYRILRPFTAFGEVRYEDLQVHAEAQDELTAISVLPIPDEDDRLRFLVLFSPPAVLPFEWMLTYRMPKFFDPLRERGSDFFTWAPGQLQKPSRPSVDRMSLKLVFPREFGGVQVSEELGRGQSHVTMLDSGEIVASWISEGTLQHRYGWRIEVGRYKPAGAPQQV